MSTALLIIDVQHGMFMLPQQPYEGEGIVERIAGLLVRAREAGTPVFHVQHRGDPGDVLEPGTAGWPPHPRLTPASGEPVIEKSYSSAFQGTDLDRQLKRAEVDRLVIAGMQSEYCVDSACRAATALGYKITLVSDGHTTFDTEVLPARQIIAHHNLTLAGGFVTLAKAATISF